MIAGDPRDVSLKGETETNRLALEVRGASKLYGDNQVLDNVDITVQRGRVLGLLGPNGAGKSTLLKIIAGAVLPTSGQLVIGNEILDGSNYNPRVASAHGIHIVYQELSLFSNLTVAENFALAGSVGSEGSRRDRRARVESAINEVFRDCSIRASAEVATLTVAEQQMVEIALTVSEPNLALLILDEPTSALPAERANQLHNYLMRRKADGISIIYVTHKLDEVLVVSDEIVVLRDGQIHWQGAPGSMTSAELLVTLGRARGDDEAVLLPPDAETTEGWVIPAPTSSDSRRPVLELDGLHGRNLHPISLVVNPGEVVGIAGLEGAGQRVLLREIFTTSRKRRPSGLAASGKIAYVSGDRQREGIFRLWNIYENILVSALPLVSRRGVVRTGEASKLVARWYATLRVVAQGPKALITSLSGGNQQKVIIARGLASGAPLVLLDDPTRGVDIETKAEFYELLHDIRAQGRSALLYSTEDREFLECDRVYVMKDGAVAKELVGNEITTEAIINWSYADAEGDKVSGGGVGPTAPDMGVATPRTAARTGTLSVPARLARSLTSGSTSRLLLPELLFVAVVAATAVADPSSLNTGGIDLLLEGIVALVLAALAQMFVILSGGFDIGLGYAIGFTSVISATYLVSDVWLGALLLIAVVAGYGLMAVLVEFTGVPAVVVTLGASFIWLGLGIIVQPVPGGSVPSWLESGLNATFPDVPEPVYICVALALVGFLVLRRWRYGVALRGFGNSRQSYVNGGRSPLFAMTTLYLLAGLCVVGAGLFTTVVSTASDINATSTLTLGSVAAVVLGGAEFVGGVVEPIGVILAAIALGLLSSLMAFWNVNPDYVSAVEGLMLVVAMGARWIGKRASAWSS